MEFLQLTSPEDFRAKNIYESYCASFTEDERRSEKQFQQLFAHPKVKVFSVIDQFENIGYLILWELSNFSFVEHLEIFVEHRNKKYGSEMMKMLFKDFSRLVLEAEPENQDDNSKRRISFYQKNGFTIIDETYMQPSYGEGKKPLNLLLFANWKPESLERIKEEIYDVVYV
ncbi:GNAT family N-acetyltransferase [Chryseobacterium koreense]|uniref:GNAT family N-acetyltransferase n=1 Tax=Chryseobacterium koreense TaxID=232216 RepID=UPI0026EF83E5|nr:GNAT family N-acetyltransferase [Chryseobacterium koreense]